MRSNATTSNKALAISNDNGQVDVIRKDKDVYAALVKAYAVCGRVEGGKRFLSKIESALDTQEDVTSVRDVVALKGFLPEWLKNGSFREAYTHAVEHLSTHARHIAMAAICIKAADGDAITVAHRGIRRSSC